MTEARRGQQQTQEPPVPGQEMVADHCRILATGSPGFAPGSNTGPWCSSSCSRLHAAALQRTVEALAGRLVHKQNFRRLIEQQELVEETGETSMETGGRPAKLFRFRPAVLMERTVAGTKLPIARG